MYRCPECYNEMVLKSEHHGVKGTSDKYIVFTYHCPDCTITLEKIFYLNESNLIFDDYALESII